MQSPAPATTLSALDGQVEDKVPRSTGRTVATAAVLVAVVAGGTAGVLHFGKSLSITRGGGGQAQPAVTPVGASDEQPGATSANNDGAVSAPNGAGESGSAHAGQGTTPGDGGPAEPSGGADQSTAAAQTDKPMGSNKSQAGKALSRRPDKACVDPSSSSTAAKSAEPDGAEDRGEPEHAADAADSSVAGREGVPGGPVRPPPLKPNQWLMKARFAAAGKAPAPAGEQTVTRAAAKRESAAAIVAQRKADEEYLRRWREAQKRWEELDGQGGGQW